MKAVKEFYVIVSKDKKYFTGTSYQPHELNCTQLTRMRGFKTKEEAEVGLKDGIEFWKNTIEDYQQRQEAQAAYFNLQGVEGWKEQIEIEKKKLEALEGGTIKKVSISWEIEE